MREIKYLLVILLAIVQLTQFSAQSIDWDKMIEQWRTEYHVPGMSVGIIKDGKVILSKGYGVLEEGKDQKVDQNTLFSIASNTKAFISASIATLVEDGKLNWDDKVKKYLPYFELYDPCVSDMMTIRDLLCHRSGLGTFSGDVIWYRSNYTAEEVAKHTAELPPQFEFRNGFGYSNVMFITAGEIIRAVTGKKWDDYVKENFLAPLEMSRTTTSTHDLEKISNVASPHIPQGDKNEPTPWVDWENMGAAGGIISTSDDMLKWLKLQLNKGIDSGDTFFLEANQNVMWTPHNNFPVSKISHETFGRNFNAYGLGWGLNEYRGHFVVSHTGGYDGMYSSVYLLPYDHTGIVVLTNSMYSIGPMLTYEIIDKLFSLSQKDWKERGISQDEAHFQDRANRIKERVDARQSGTQPTMNQDQITNLYRSPMYGDIKIQTENGKLVIDFIPAPGLKAILTHWHQDVYLLNWIEEQAWFSFGTVQILKDNNGNASGLLFDVPNDDIFFEEINAVRVKP
ncbi:MAG TPA: serine hydrolase [Saprospiraceae bacterium]|nr:serine hydrolase [Saprospiraceae bacterium]